MPSRTMRLGLALLLTAVLAGTAAFAAAALSPGDGAKVPNHFAIAAPREGDAWNYTVAGLDGELLTQPGAPNDWPVVRLDMSRTGPVAQLDSQGQPRTGTGLDVLQVFANDATAEDSRTRTARLVRFATADAETLSRSDLVQGGGEAEFIVEGVPAGLDALFVDSELQSTWTTTYAQQAPCGHWSSLQENAKTSHIKVAGCRPTGWKAVGLENGLLVVQGTDDTGGLTQLSFAPHVPVPVRVLQAPWWDATVTMVWTLASFTPGGEPSAAPSIPGAAPVVSFAAREPFGPDESGVTHAFPLSEAYGIATASGPLATFLSSHAGAYLQSASYVDRVDDSSVPRNHTYEWTLQATDGHSAAKVEVVRYYRVPNDNGTEAMVRSLPVPPVLPVIINTLDADDGPFPTADLLPAQLPTVASVMERSRAYAASDMTGNAWGFAITCADAMCGAAKSMVIAGHDDKYREGQYVSVAAVIGFRRTAEMVGVDDSGATVQHLVAYADAYQAATIGPYTVQGGQTERPQFLRASQSSGPAWDWNRGAVAGGTVLGLAALAFAAKALFALWHRTIEEHPVRTQLLQLLEAEPGLHHQEIMRRLGKGNSVVAHHLGALERDGRVISRQGPRYRCYFLAGLDRRTADAAPLTKSDLARRILDELAKGPATGQDLAGRLGVAPSSIAFHVKRFQEAGLLLASREGRLVRLSATEAGRHAASAA